MLIVNSLAPETCFVVMIKSDTASYLSDMINNLLSAAGRKQNLI